MTDQVTVINDAEKTSRTKQFLNRHKTKLQVAGIALATGTVFVLGRRSRDVVENVDIDVDVETPDEKN